MPTLKNLLSVQQAKMSQILSSSDDNNSSSSYNANNTNTNICSSINSINVVKGDTNPLMQDLMSLIREQSKLISTLQKMIENLNAKLKMFENTRDVVRDVEKDVLQDVSNKGKSENIDINVTTSSIPIELSWLNLSLNSFKIKCKSLLLT